MCLSVNESLRVITLRQRASKGVTDSDTSISLAYHAVTIAPGSPILPSSVTPYIDFRLACPTKSIVARRLPPWRAVIPSPVATAIRLCSDPGVPTICQCDNKLIFGVTMDTRYTRALWSAISHWIGVSPTSPVALETLTAASNRTPARRAWRGRCVCVTRGNLNAQFNTLCFTLVSWHCDTHSTSAWNSAYEQVSAMFISVPPFLEHTQGLRSAPWFQSCHLWSW